MSKIAWSEYDLEMTANVITKINPHCNFSKEELISYIKDLAYNYAIQCTQKGIRPSITGTGGWYVTFIPCEYDPHFEYSAQVTLMSHLVSNYISN